MCEIVSQSLDGLIACTTFDSILPGRQSRRRLKQLKAAGDGLRPPEMRP
jgi:hypothetical protein